MITQKEFTQAVAGTTGRDIFTVAGVVNDLWVEMEIETGEISEMLAGEMEMIAVRDLA